jgi:hypothetical protein
MIRGKNVNEVQIGAEMFYQRQCKLKCAQRWRGKIQRHKDVLDLQGLLLLFAGPVAC